MSVRGRSRGTPSESPLNRLSSLPLGIALPCAADSQEPWNFGRDSAQGQKLPRTSSTKVLANFVVHCAHRTYCWHRVCRCIRQSRGRVGSGKAQQRDSTHPHLGIAARLHRNGRLPLRYGSLLNIPVARRRGRSRTTVVQRATRRRWTGAGSCTALAKGAALQSRRIRRKPARLLDRRDPFAIGKAAGRRARANHVPCSPTAAVARAAVRRTQCATTWR
jgi:hypothetical protein